MAGDGKPWCGLGDNRLSHCDQGVARAVGGNLDVCQSREHVGLMGPDGLVAQQAGHQDQGSFHEAMVSIASRFVNGLAPRACAIRVLLEVGRGSGGDGFRCQVATALEEVERIEAADHGGEPFAYAGGGTADGHEGWT